MTVEDTCLKSMMMIHMSWAVMAVIMALSIVLATTTDDIMRKQLTWITECALICQIISLVLYIVLEGI